MVQLSYPYMTTGKNIALIIQTFFSKVMCLLFNMLSRFVIAFLPRKKCLLILEQVFCFVLFCFNIGASVPSSKDQVSFNFMAAVIVCSDFRTQQNKLCHYFTFSSSICHEVMGLDAMILVFLMLNFKPVFSLSSFTLIRRLF